MTTFVLVDSFLKSANGLEKEHRQKLLKAMLLFYGSPQHPGLNYEKLAGKAASMHSIRIDQGYRVILEGPPASATFHYVGTHEDAYRFADKAIPVIRARVGPPQAA